MSLNGESPSGPKVCVCLKDCYLSLSWSLMSEPISCVKDDSVYLVSIHISISSRSLSPVKLSQIQWVFTDIYFHNVYGWIAILPNILQISLKNTFYSASTLHYIKSLAELILKDLIETSWILYEPINKISHRYSKTWSDIFLTCGKIKNVDVL